eukprot:SAG11_NODE_15345_length_581_cov_1.072614_2_plen_107_part_00
MPPQEFKEAVKKGYRRQSRKHHPDKGGHEADFKALKEAEECLSDEWKKSLYDNWLAGNQSTPFEQNDFPGEKYAPSHCGTAAPLRTFSHVWAISLHQITVTVCTTF